jgi:hypothetical protein
MNVSAHFGGRVVRRTGRLFLARRLGGRRSWWIVASVLAGLALPASASAEFSWSATGGLPDTAGFFDALACPSASQCTAINSGGTAATFDPSSPDDATLTELDGVSPSSWFACPSSTQCIALAGGSPITFTPGSVTDTLLDAPGGGTAIACPSTTQCTVVGVGDGETTFNPLDPTSPTSLTLDSEGLMSAVSCPSVTQCTAVGLGDGLEPTGVEVTFDPTNPSEQSPTPVTIDDGRVFCSLGSCAEDDNLVSVSCPGTLQCTALDFDGRALTFNPARPGTPVVLRAGGSGSVVCPTVTDCVAPSDNAQDVGDVVEGDPLSRDVWSTQTIFGTASVAAISCVSPELCVAVDRMGYGVAVEGMAHVSVGNSPAPSGELPDPEANVGDARVRGLAAGVAVSCFGSPSSNCEVKLTLSRHGAGAAYGMLRSSIGGGQQTTLHVTLDREARALLAAHHTLAVTVRGVERRAVVYSRLLRFRAS